MSRLISPSSGGGDRTRTFSSVLHGARELHTASPVRVYIVLGGSALLGGYFYWLYFNHPQHHELTHQATILADTDQPLMTQLDRNGTNTHCDAALMFGCVTRELR
jgi:hypothetical protein